MVGACPYPVPQGSQVLLRNTALAAQTAGHDVRLVVYGFGAGDDASGLSVRRGEGFPFGRKMAAGPSFAKPFHDTALLGALRRVIRDERIDIVHAHNYEALMVTLASGHHPIVYHAHNAMADELPHFLPRWMQPDSMGRWLDRTFPKKADAVITPHDRLREYLIESGRKPEFVYVIPPSIEVDEFDTSEETAANPPILYTGNLDRYQNLNVLERVVRRIRKTRPDTRFHVVTSAQGNVQGAETIRVGDARELREVLRRDAVVACPRVSWSGYPIKLLNAMAVGRAVVACASAAYPIEHEQNGLVVPDNDEAAFAEAVIRLLEDHALRKRLGDAARETMIVHHTDEVIGTEIDQVYRAVMAQSG